MQWEVRLAEEFDPEFDELPEIVQDELLARARLLETLLLVAADKSGVKERRFYRRLIKLADERFDKHLQKEK